MKSRILLIILSFFLFSAAHSQQSYELDKIDSIVSSHISLKHIPGLALAIIKNGNIEKKSYYGLADLESRTPVDSNTVFEIASMTKQITCAGILLLQEDGLLSTSDKLSTYLQDLPAAWKEITIEQLMNHTSGLRDDWDEPTPYFFANNTDRKLSIAQQEYPLLFPPGEGFQYSSGPFFLGLVIEKITGTHYAHFLKKRIFEKLKMSDTYVYDSTSIPKTLATGYRWNREKHETGSTIPATALSRADVGVITTLSDMIKWSLALNDNRLLNSESLKSLFTPGRLKTGHSIPYGFGWYIYFFRDQLIFEHGGAFRTGFNSRISRFPDAGVEIILLCNKWRAELSDLTYALASLYEPGFRRISEINKQNTGREKRDRVISGLFYDLSVKKFSMGKLYQQVNVSGFDSNELSELLKGFKGVEFIGAKARASDPVRIYGSNIHEILYYKVTADNTTYWSLAYDDKGTLISVNLED